MISEKTLFVLGAGASVPYGYPTGEELRKFICTEMQKDFAGYFGVENDIELNQPRSNVSNLNRRFNVFCDAFKRSSRPSIDLFLATNPQYLEIGKLAIVRSLIHYENNSVFREDMADNKQDWYSYLYRRMVDSLITPESHSRFKENNVSFITFNYDRSLEYFIFDSLCNSFSEYKISINASIENEITKILPFPIIHVHGELAPLKLDGAGYCYRAKILDEDDKLLVKNIKIIYEQSATINEEARKLIREADRIFFLGFGYADENLKILGLPDSLDFRLKIYGTAFGNTQREISAIKMKFQKPEHNYPEFIIEDRDCFSLLREYL